MRRNDTGQTYTVNVYKKGEDKVVHVWKGRACNLLDAFSQARHDYDPHRWSGTVTTLLVKRQDNEA
jgi:hypothetical protein